MALISTKIRSQASELHDQQYYLVVEAHVGVEMKCTPPLQQNMQGGKTPPNKVKVALKIAENTSQVPEDAQEHIRNMAARIRSANGMPSREK